MSRDGPARKQVWLPSSGVWAVLPEQPAETDEHPGVSRQSRRQSSTSGQQKRGDRRGRKSAPPSRAAGDGGSGGQPEQIGAPQEAQPAAGTAGAAAPPAAPGGGSPGPSCQAAPLGSGYTGFELQHSDLEASDVEEVEPAPTCPICECSSSATVFSAAAAAAASSPLLARLLPTPANADPLKLQRRARTPTLPPAQSPPEIPCAGLADIIELSDKAVVTACMHAFCHPCISRWLTHHQRVCPLCKARVSSGGCLHSWLAFGEVAGLETGWWADRRPCASAAGCPLLLPICVLQTSVAPCCCGFSSLAVLYDISADGEYKERVVPPSPKHPAATAGSDAEGSGLPLLQRLQDFLGGVAGLLDPYEAQQRAGQQQRGRHQQQQPQQQQLQLRHESGNGRIGWGSSASQRHRPAQLQAAAAEGAAGPRPYFWRLQQRLQAGAYRPGGGEGVHGGSWGALQQGGGLGEQQGAVSEEDYVLLWRRQVYDQVRCQPLFAFFC